MAWYPAWYLSVHGEEMLGVAMAGAAPDQRRPDRGEAVDLVLSGIRVRFGRLLTGARRPAWSGAGAALALLGPMVLAATHLWSFTRTWPAGLGIPGTGAVTAIVFAAGWAMIAVVAALRWRWLAAVGASLGAAGEAAHLAVRYGTDPAFAAGSWWQLVLAIATALAAITALAGDKGDSRPLSWRAIAAGWIASTVFGTAPLIEWAVSTRTPGAVFVPPAGIQFLLNQGVFLLFVITLLAVVLRLELAVRRRVFVLSAAPAAAAVFSAIVFGGGILVYDARSTVSQAPFIWPQWAALLGVPALALLAGFIWLGRHERTLPAAAGPGSAGA